jgi:hypothetical protein
MESGYIFLCNKIENYILYFPVVLLLCGVSQSNVIYEINIS